jgi:hypothetical protein
VSARRASAGRDRDHQRPARPRVLKLRLSDEEFADVETAASQAGLTPSGYAAEAALAAARGGRPPVPDPWRQALAEVMDARTQVRRFGVNVNQAVRVLNATGEAPEWFGRAVALTDRAVERLDEAALALMRRLP